MTTPASTVADFDFGTGIYSFTQASKIIRSRGDITENQLRYWMNSGLTPASWPDYGPYKLLSFHDLISLETVRRFRAQDVPLQRVRKAHEKLHELRPDVARPFAHQIFYTDGANIWMELNGMTTEIVGRNRGNTVWQDAIATFAKEIQFDTQGLATRWRLSEWVEINPAVQFGSPVVRGTRIPTSTILRQIQNASKEQVADWYDLTTQQIQEVVEFAPAA